MTLDCTCTRLKEAEAKAARWDGVVRCGECEMGSDVVAPDYGAGFLWCELMELPAASGHFCGWAKRREDA